MTNDRFNRLIRSLSRLLSPPDRSNGGVLVDGTRFDAWTRMLVAESSRRSTLKAVAGGALGALLAALGREEAEAKCVKLGKKCKKKKGKKKCCGGAKCKGKKCKCPSGTEECDGKCVPTGACPCPGGTEECNGECVPTGSCPCPGGTEECDGECVAECPAGITTRNPTNCGCCQANGAPPSPNCASFGACCSGACVPIGGGVSICAGRSGGSACEFDAQCGSNICDNGTCTCNDETEACAAQEECCDGQCVAVCLAGITTRNPTNCGCCQVNGAPPSPNCASFGACCSGACVPIGGGVSICTGIASGNACEFDAQCQSGNCSNGACD